MHSNDLVLIQSDIKNWLNVEKSYIFHLSPVGKSPVRYSAVSLYLALIT